MYDIKISSHTVLFLLEGYTDSEINEIKTKYHSKSDKLINTFLQFQYLKYLYDL